jgi:peptide/nickel transport system permease protein
VSTVELDTPAVVRRRGWSIPGLRATGPIGHISAGVVATAVLVAIVGPWIAPYDPDAVDLKYAYVGGYGGHLLGFDGQGRDILSRLLAGARTSLLGPLVVVVLAMLFGTVLAVASAWRGGRFDMIVSAALDVLFAFPAIVLAIIAAVIWGAGLTAASIALAIAYMPYVARILRGAALRERSRDYVAALEVQGLRAWSICARHIARNLVPLISAQAAILFGYAMVDLAAISFIGLGVQPPRADWGVMVSTGQSGVLQGYPMESIGAGLCIVIVVIAVNLLGEKLTERASEVRR